MFFTVSELEVKKIRFDEVFKPGELDLGDPLFAQTSSLHATGVAELLPNTEGEIRVKGHIQTVVEADCDRCLARAQFPIDSGFDLFYRPASDIADEPDEVAIDEGEAEIGFYDKDRLELEQILQEQILLLLPMRRICSEACKGICPVCGKDRNQASCDCRSVAADDRWAALKNL